MHTIAIRIGILVVVALGLIACGSSAADLKVGECFDAPNEVDTEVTAVEKHDCTEPHNAEVVAVHEVAGGDDAAYPTQAEWEASIRTVCVPAFNAYTGLDFDSDPDWDIGYLVPTSDGWNDGDRALSCYATRIDGAPTSVSLRVGG